MDFIKLTEQFSNNNIYIKPSTITSIIYMADEGLTKIIFGNSYSTLVVESPDEVFELIKQQRAKDSPWTPMELPFQ